MTAHKHNHNLRRGTSLLELVIAIGIFGIIAVFFVQTLMAGTLQVADGRLRMTATAIATQQMEQLRNLPYDDVAVVGGIPAGSIQPHVTVTQGAQTYDVVTDIRYVDDSFDGTVAGSPTDPIPSDYKNVRIDVTWGDAGPLRRVRLESRFVPPGMELAAGGGTLAVNVFDAEGQPLSNATVTVVNAGMTPAVSIAAFSDTAGHVIVPGAPAGSGYAITVAKDGYESVTTYPPYPATAFHPADQHATVVEATLTMQGIVSGRLADAAVRTVDPLGASVSGIPLDISGGRILGTDTAGLPVPGYAGTFTTGADGRYALGRRAPGTYVVTVGGTRYRLIDVRDAATPERDTFALSQGADRDIDIVVADNQIPSMLVTVTAAAGGAVVPGATVRLTGTGYDATATADAAGVAYFPVAADAPLSAGSYVLEVTATGYQSWSQDITVPSGLFEVAATMTAV